MLLIIIVFEKYAHLRIQDLTGYGKFSGYRRPSIKLCINICRKLGYNVFPGFGGLTTHTVHRASIYVRE